MAHSNQAAIWNITFCHQNFILRVLFAYNSLYFCSELWCGGAEHLCAVAEFQNALICAS